jgi:lipoate-protein ligase B
MKECRLLDIKHLDYPEALDLMRRLAAVKGSVAFPEVLITTEHEPVLTMGRRGGPEDVVASKAMLGQAGVTVHHSERGGLVTYHGPGQLVVYPVFQLRALSLGVVSLVNSLEEAVMAALGEYGLGAEKLEGHPGVWVGRRKIASVGLAVRRGISFHGLSLNRDPDLDHFRLINPCGLEADRMTSMTDLLGVPVPDAELRARLHDHLSRIFKINLKPWSLAEVRAALDEYEHHPAQAALA